MIVTKLSKFVVNLKYEDIPISIIDKAKLCFLDFLGVTYRGFHEKSVQISIDSIKEIYGTDINTNDNSYNSYNNKNNKKSLIIGEGYSDILNAGFINGISAHVLDLDDGHRFAQLHPGCVVFPSALAIAEANNISGKKFLEAVICGYEVAIVIGMLANPYHRNQGFHSTGTIGTFASGAVVSKLLDLDLEKTVNTLGLCGTQSSGLLESDHQGTMGKQLHIGNAVYNGILSGYLAKNGITGAESIIEGEEGFLKAMATEHFKNICSNHVNYNNSNSNNVGADDYFKNYLNESLGKFHITDVYFKKYPFCRHLHSSIDATLNINNKFIFDIKDIEKITIKTYKIAAEHNNFNPKTKEDIRQSLPYAVATAIFKNNLNLDIIENSVSEDNYEDNYTFKSILDKIIIEEDEKLSQLVPKYRPSKVIIKTKNEIYEDFVEFPLGEVENPLSKEDILDKFKILNPNFDFKKLVLIDNMESCNIYEFMKNFH